MRVEKLSYSRCWRASRRLVLGNWCQLVAGSRSSPRYPAWNVNRIPGHVSEPMKMTLHPSSRLFSFARCKIPRTIPRGIHRPSQETASRCQRAAREMRRDSIPSSLLRAVERTVVPRTPRRITGRGRELVASSIERVKAARKRTVGGRRAESVERAGDVIGPGQRRDASCTVSARLSVAWRSYPHFGRANRRGHVVGSIDPSSDRRNTVHVHEEESRRPGSEITGVRR